MFTKMKESKGFTLVELMIVVAIIGILAAVAVPYYQKYIQKARLTSLVWPGVHAIETAEASYYSLNNTFTTTSTTQFTSDANTQYIGTPTVDGTSGALSITITSSGATSPLHALNNYTLTATPNISSGTIASWSYGGNVASIMGLSGAQ